MDPGGKPERAGASAIVVGQTACGMIHDLSNILQTAILRAELTLTTEKLSREGVERIEQLMAEAREVAEVLRAVLERGRALVEALPPVDLDTVAAAAIPQDVGFEASPVPLPVRADSAQLADAFEIAVALLRVGSPPTTSLEIKLFSSPEENPPELPARFSVPGYAVVRLTRRGAGNRLPLGENLARRPGGIVDADPDLLRLRGILRQHRAESHILESPPGEAPVLTLRVYFPLAS